MFPRVTQDLLDSHVIITARHDDMADHWLRSRPFELVVGIADRLRKLNHKGRVIWSSSIQPEFQSAALFPVYRRQFVVGTWNEYDGFDRFMMAPGGCHQQAEQEQKRPLFFHERSLLGFILTTLTQLFKNSTEAVEDTVDPAEALPYQGRAQTGGRLRPCENTLPVWTELHLAFP
jgi:hypothetical protein